MKIQLSLVILLVAAFLLSACGTQPTPPPTAVLPTIPPPTPTLPPYLFHDDFDGALMEGWFWLGEDPAKWSLTDAPGFLRIVAQPSNIAADGRLRNFLVRAIPEGDFQIETFVKFEPFSNFQFAGLLIYQEQGRAMQFGRAFAHCDFPFCMDNAIYFDLMDPEAANPPNYATPVTETSQAYLRLRREGDQYSGFYSADGVNWTLIGMHTSGIAPISIGLIASQGYEELAPADFDYFEVSLP